jgi:hypothetical protein
MSDVNISKFRAQVIRTGSTPASPGFVVSEGQNPVDPSGSGQTHLPVTIATVSTGLSITESQILSGAGLVSQYIRGDGSLADFPATTGGGSSVSYYLNGSVSQGTIGGVAYKELNRAPVFGAGTDITISADGYIASFITDALDPNKLLIPAGNWNFETYFSASSSGGSPSFYVELYKYNGTTFTLIASSSTAPELIAFGTNLNPYFSTLAVPETVLALTDRLAIRYFVTHSGRTITLHTENDHLCQVITTFTTGLTALNGLTTQVQFFAVGTTGTDFNIASSTDTHTFNLPTASATNRGALSSSDWTTFNGKENAITAGTTLQYFRGDKTFQTLNTAAVPELTNLYYTEARVNANTNVAANTAARHNAVTLGTANGLSLSTQVLSLGLASAGVTGALSGTDWTTFNNKTSNLGTVTSVGLSSATSGVTIGSTPVTTSGTITLAIATASGAQNGLLSSTDWTTFNGKQNALTNPVTGTGTTNYLPKFTGSTTITSSNLITDSSGNLGLAVFPSAWGFGKAIEFQTIGNAVWGVNSTQFNVIQNAYFDSGYKYASTNPASYYQQASGDHAWYNAASGTAGNAISFIKAMTLTSGGNLLVGTTTDAGYKLDVNGTGRFSGGVLFNVAQSITTAGSIGYHSSVGVFIYGKAGTSYDFRLYNGGGVTVMSNPTGTQNVEFLGAATFSSSVTATQFITGGTPSNTAGFTNTIYAEGNLPSLTLSNTNTNTGKFTLGVTNGNLGIWNNATSTYALFITSSNYVLIGTTTSGSSKLRLVGLPTSSAGLSSGDVYNLAGTLMIA